MLDLRYSMPILPGEQLLIVPTLVVNIKVRKRRYLLVNPIVTDQFDTGLTHEPLCQGFQAVRKVRVVDVVDAVGKIVVEIEVEAFAHGVQTVKEVDAIQVHEVTVRSVAPIFRGLDGNGRILAQFENVIAGDVHYADICQTVPFLVHFRTWGLPEERGPVI